MRATFDTRFQRFFAASGFIFAIFVGAGLEGFWPQPPSFGWSATTTARYYVVHRDGFRIGITLNTIGMAFLLAWTVQYSYMLWRLEDRASDGGSKVTVIVAALSLLASPILLSFDLAIFAIAAFRPGSTDPSVTRALSDIGWISSELIWPMLGAGMALGGALMLRRRHEPGGFPAWVGWYSMLAAAIEFFQIPIIFIKTGPFSANGVFPWYATTFSWGIWAMVIAVAMLRMLRTPREPAATATTPSIQEEPSHA